MNFYVISYTFTVSNKFSFIKKVTFNLTSPYFSTLEALSFFVFFEIRVINSKEECICEFHLVYLILYSF